MISGIHIMYIPPNDAKVANSTNKDWVILDLRCRSVYDTESAYKI